jgi:HK97 family phage prohead protease
MASDAPTDNLLRAWVDPEAIEFRAAADGEAGDVMTGHFAVFNRWTKIDSWYEGKFMERLAPGSFADTLASSRAVKVLYDHGADPMIGNKPLGTPRSVSEDRKGVKYEVDLFDASYVNDLKPALRAGQLGASFRFRVTDEEWNQQPKRSKDNPEGLPERTITGVELYEFGPVTFPAYAEATAGMRSGTDAFLDHLMTDPRFVARFAERTSPRVAEHVLSDAQPKIKINVKALEPADASRAVLDAIASCEAANGADWRSDPAAPEEPNHVRSEASDHDARLRWLRSRRLA